jgi:hypothetical protein
MEWSRPVAFLVEFAVALRRRRRGGFAMTQARTAQNTLWPLPWRGPLAFVLLGIVSVLGPDITPSQYWPDLVHYIPRYVLLAFSIGFGLAAIGSPQRIDKMFGIAVIIAGGWMIVHIATECLRIIKR